jgi:hypothetical protein
VTDAENRVAKFFMGPAPKPKPVHKAALMRADGAVSPLCAARPRKLNLSRETWSLVWSSVTCRRCRAVRESQEKKP